VLIVNLYPISIPYLYVGLIILEIGFSRFLKHILEGLTPGGPKLPVVLNGAKSARIRRITNFVSVFFVAYHFSSVAESLVAET
jgi:hypothetical protein